MATETVRVNPFVLTWAREEAGLTREDAAAKADVDLEALSGWEAGASSPGISQLRALAGAYRRPLTVLLLPQPPPHDPSPRDFRTVNGAAPDLSPAAHFIIRRARRLQSLLTEVTIELPGAWPEARLIRANLNAPAEDAARSQRELTGVTLKAQESWPDAGAATREWRASLQRTCGVLSLVESIPREECRGMALSHERIPTIIMTSTAGEPPAARIFTLAHELGHLTLSQDGVCLEREDDSDKGRTERWCNKFAGAFLLPAEALDSLASDPMLRSDPVAAVSRTANLLEVSRDVVSIRLEETGRANRGFYHRLEPSFKRGSPGPHRREDIRIPAAQRALNRLGDAPIRALRRALNEDLVDLREVAEVLDIGADRLGELEELAERRVGRTR
jgi:Zn-dependent peptidase ImmA (M78 family)/DNA-binding XRE family transcriptional regulator